MTHRDLERHPFTQIRYELHGPVARIVLDRPERRNAQSRVLREEMDDAFMLAEWDDAVRVVILSGEGGNFSSGHDLGTPEEVADRESRPYTDTLPNRYAHMFEINVANTLRWREFPKPTIAQVDGFCIFGGWLIASAMDLVFAADDSQFLPSQVQYYSIPWDLGVRKTKEVLFEGRFVEAQEALELGFVNRIYPSAELAEQTMAFARRVAENDPFDLRMVKEATNAAQDAMGFRASMRDGFAFHTLRMEASRERLGPDFDKQKRLPGVGEAFERAVMEDPRS